MRKEKLVGLLAIAATFLFAGCSGSVEIGPVPTITPKPTVTPAPTPTPVVVEVVKGEDEKEETVYDTKLYKEYYESEGELPEMDLAYEGIFEVGVGVLQSDLENKELKNFIKTQFDTISVRDVMDPEYLMDYEASAASGDLTRISLDFSAADEILKFAEDNDLKVRGPRLITNETPYWALTKDFSEDQVVTTVDETGTEVTTVEYASPEVAMQRMQNYITDVINYCNTNYPDLVISWEVLDDVIYPENKHELKYRTDTPWHYAIGDEYIVKACETARAVATEEQSLIFTHDALDEAAYTPPAVALLTSLKEQGLIDGIGIQAHYTPGGPNVMVMQSMFKSLGELGLELHITEFYVDSNDGGIGDFDFTEEELLARAAKRYKNLQTLFVNMDTSYDIVSVNFEGVLDTTAVVNQPTDYYNTELGQIVNGVRLFSETYFFDEELNIKDNFFAFMGDANIKGY